MPAFNKLIYNGTEYDLGGGGNIGEPLNLTVTAGVLEATITWEDNEIGTIPATSFAKSELVRKVGSAPTSPSDGTLVVTETVKDTYKVSGYTDSGLTDGTTYYYRVFSYSDLGGISYCDAVNVTASSVINYTITGSTTVGSFTPGSFSDLQGFYMSPDGENAYMTFWNSGSGIMAQYSLSTPWDISTASQTQYISVTKPNGFYFSNDGTYIFLSTEDGMNIVRYSLSTPWDISTASQDSGQVLNVDSSRFAANVCLSDDGDYIWFGVDALYEIIQYELTTPFDLTTATNQKVLNTSERSPAVMVKNEGKYMYKTLNGPVEQYELATPYDITSTATEIGSYSVTVGEHRCLFVSNDCKYWAIGNNSGGITQFEAQPIS